MSDAHDEQLLRVIRQEILPVLLAYLVPGGLEIMIRRLQRDYPSLDLFSKD